MTRWLNAAAAALALLMSLAIAVEPEGRMGHATDFVHGPAASAAVVERGGRRGLVDATGTFVPLGDYQRIVSTSAVVDGILRELCEPTRVLRYTARSADPTKNAYHYHFAGKGAEQEVTQLEALIALEPDLVLLHSLGQPERVARLRDAGLTVFDFGEMRGRSTLLPNLRAVGALVGRPAHGASLARRFAHRLDTVAAGVPHAVRPTAVYLSIHGDQVYGGTQGTSYHDVLLAAGLRDAAAEAGYRHWPDYAPEQLLQLDPEVIVTHTSMVPALCAHHVLGRLRACGEGGRVLSLPSGLVESPGLPMLVAAERLFEQAHSRARGLGTPAGAAVSSR